MPDLDIPRSGVKDRMADSLVQHETVSVDLGPRSYEIVIGRGLLGSIAEFVDRWRGANGAKKPSQAGALAAIVTDEHVLEHAEDVVTSLVHAGWRTELIELPAGEPTKRLEVIAGIYDRLVEMQADRRTLLIAVGGGVIGDAAGFAAATYGRGIDFLQVPTTLLADVDSSVGGKVGINHPQAKNLIGAFHQPIGVVIDTDALATLPVRDFRSGLAEVVKYGVILDEELFAFLERHRDDLNRREATAVQHAIARSCRLKADVVEQDEYETTGLRAVLNYGHTFGHAFEALCGYGELLHGEAVAIGMVYASRLAECLGRIDAEDTRRQVDLLHALGLPTRLPGGFEPGINEMLARMRLDKKSVGGQLRFVLPTRIGHVELVDDVPLEIVRAVLEES
ncbi:MAG: 3-dehydroquinate synthase [Planctomycetaceae bacterium]